MCSSQEEKDKWLEDIQTAILFAKDETRTQTKVLYPSLQSNSQYTTTTTTTVTTPVV